MSALALLALLIAGCSWSLAERTVAMVAIGCAAGDYVTTRIGRAAGIDEANLLLENPRVVIPVKVGTIAAAAVVGELDGDRLWWWRAAAVANCGVTAWNAAMIQREAAR